MSIKTFVRVSVTLSVAFGSVAVLWAGLNWPPALWILKYGVHPGCKPTGKVVKAEGVEFVMIAPGICRIGSDYMARHPKEKYLQGWGFTKGDVLGRLRDTIDLPWGKAVKPSCEMPVHWVEFPRGFGVTRTEITNAEYERFDPKHYRSCSSGDRDPVVSVTWEEVRKYCAWLSKKSGLWIRLPSESEWECACRAGSETKYPFGNDASQLGEYAWYEKDSSGGVHEVATRKANPWGLFDMEGNVSEWCRDRWHGSYLLTRKMKEKDGSVATETVDRAPDDGTAWERGGMPLRVVRGGSWFGRIEYCWPAFRDEYSSSGRVELIGFRPALEYGRPPPSRH